MGVCHRPPNQAEEVDCLFYKQLGDRSRFPALVLCGDFNLTDIFWESNTAKTRLYRWFLECMEEFFLVQLLSKPARGGTMLDLLLENRERLVGDVVVGGPLGHSDHEIIVFVLW